MKTRQVILDSIEYQKVLEIRRKVFIEEQSVPEVMEIDQYERECEYFLTFLSEAVSTGRLRVKPPHIKFERIATLKEFRGRGAGRELLTAMQDFAKHNYPSLIPYMHSQLEAVDFYQKLGWIPLGEIFYEASIPHRAMTLPS